MTQDHCPPDAVIHAIAAGDPCPPDIRRHVDTCPACMQRLEKASVDESFLTRFRDVVTQHLPPAEAPRIIGYRILGLHDSGAQGVVYKAIQESTSRLVAIKIIRADDHNTEHHERARREVEIIARFDHPGIVTIYESRELADGRHAVIMEYVDGVPLDKWRPRSGDDSRARLEVFEQVCLAIHHAHLNGVIHRDLKPANILVDEPGRPVVLDFGLARLEDSFTTRAGEFAGTPAYASPEQAAGDPAQVDALTDVYSLGVILYHSVCGRLPYTLDGTILDMVATIRTTEPERPRAVKPGLNPDLEAVMLSALRKEKFGRYQSAEALARDVRRVLDGLPVEARSGSGWYLLRKAAFVNRRRLALTAVAALLLVAAAATVFISITGAHAAAQREAAERERARRERIHARAVTELLRDAIPVPDPANPETGGLIAAGFRRLHQRLETGVFADEPELDQEIRRLWGSVYTGLGSSRVTESVEYAEMSLRNGLIRLRDQVGDADHPDLAATTHELAAVLLVRGRLAESESLARSACVMRERLFGNDAAEYADSVALHARILEASDNHTEAIARADEAIQRLRAHGSGYALEIAAMTALKARAALALGVTEDAEPWIREALTVRMQRMSVQEADLLDSLEQVVLLARFAPDCGLVTQIRTAWGSEVETFADELSNDIATIRIPDPWETGRPHRTGRTDALGRLLRLYESLLGGDHLAIVGVLMTQGRAAEFEYRLDTSAETALRAGRILAQRFGENDLSVLNCYELAAVVDAYCGNVQRAAESQASAVAIWQQLPPDANDKLLAANARRKLAWFQDLAGDHEQARETYRITLEELMRILDPDHYLIALTQSGSAMCAAARHDLETADRESAAAWDRIASRTGVPGDTAAHIAFSRGHILLLQQREAEARPHLERAWERFYSRAGTGFPWRLLVIDDMIHIAEKLKDPDASAIWRGRAKPGDQ